MRTFKSVTLDTHEQPTSAAGYARKNDKNKTTGPAGSVVQGKFAAQRQPEEEPMQGKFTAQRQPEEEPIQGKFPVQRQEEEEPVQGKFPVQMQEEEEPMQGKFPVQRQEEEEPVQGKFPVQMQPEEEPVQGKFPVQASKGGSASGVPGAVQEKMEGALNASFSSVKVHANSSKASEIGARAYTQGTDIHVAPGQYNPNTGAGRELLGHELTHVAQQQEGRVQPTGEVGGLPLNDNPSLEKEADSIGSKAR